MIQRLLYSELPLWSHYTWHWTLAGLFAACLVFMSYFEYQRDVRAIDHGLSSRGWAITRTLIAALQTDYEQGRLTYESAQRLLANTVSDTSEPYAARLETSKGVAVATAGPANLLKQGDNPAKNAHDEEMFVHSDSFGLKQQSVDQSQVPPNELAAGSYVLSVALGASDARVDQTTKWYDFLLHSMWCVLFVVLTEVAVYYQQRLRSLNRQQTKSPILRHE